MGASSFFSDQEKGKALLLFTFSFPFRAKTEENHILFRTLAPPPYKGWKSRSLALRRVSFFSDVMARTAFFPAHQKEALSFSRGFFFCYDSIRKIFHLRQ